MTQTVHLNEDPEISAMQDTIADPLVSVAFEIDDDLIEAFVAQAQGAQAEELLPNFQSMQGSGMHFSVFNRSTLTRIAEASIAALSGRLHHFSNRR